MCGLGGQWVPGAQQQGGKRYDLMQRASERGITLDGHPAEINGARLPFALVSRIDGIGGSVEYAWATVERIVASHGRFGSR